MSVAIGGGNGATFTPPNGAAITLNGARADGFVSTAVGAASRAFGSGSSAYGFGSRGIGVDSAAYGKYSTSIGVGSVAVGPFSLADGGSGIAIGQLSMARGTQSIALGRGARASHSSSVAIGTGSLSGGTNTISVGRSTLKRRIVNVANGVGPSDAVNLAQVQALIGPVPPPAAGPTDAGSARQLVDDVRLEIQALRVLVKQQQARIEQLEGRNLAR